MTYLFLAVPPHCGSTTLHNYLAECKEVIPLTTTRSKAGFIEGSECLRNTGYFEPNGLFKNRLPVIVPASYAESIGNSSVYNWPGIKTTWDNNWNSSTKKNGSIRMQKTPNDVWRLKLMHPYFPNLKWILMVRNPYAYMESLIETLVKDGFNPTEHLDKILFQVINSLDIQMDNKDFLGENCYHMTYEDFVTNPDKHIAGLKAFIPGLEDLSVSGNILMKGNFITGLTCNNEERISKLRTIPGAFEAATKYFTEHETSLTNWGYTLLK